MDTNYDDMILPDDFTPSQEGTEGTATTLEIPATNTETKTLDTITEPTKTQDTTTVDTQTQEPQKIKIKFNHAEQELTLEEAAQLAQKGLNYDKAIERERQAARDSYIAEQGMEWQGKSIKTEAEYKQAIAEKELIEKYQGQNLPDEVIKELIESKKFLEEAKELQKVKTDEESRQKDYTDFISWFAEQNGRAFDTTKDTIPTEVWEANSKGKSLVDAYSRFENQQLKDRIKKLEQNEGIAAKAPVRGTSTNGTTNVNADEEDDFLRGFNSVK